MPFGLKFKNKRRYTLSQKNSFLVRVQFLDNTDMECTLTLESTGRECLESVSTSKLHLTEISYFGLRYVNKQHKVRWVELDKPLKRQMDKHANEPVLYFGVMFYLSNVESLKDETARYFYYYQVKCNVIDGLYICTEEQLAELGSYVLQAEFGDHDPELHNYDYFKYYAIFPEEYVSTKEDSTFLQRLFKDAINKHKNLRGLTPSEAEHYYILKAMNLPGFSQDSFKAKNVFHHDLILGTSYAGIVITTSQNEKAVCHEWPTIENISQSKNMLAFEVPRTKASYIPAVQFYLEDSETAKYVCKMCNLRKRFFLQNLEERESDTELESVKNAKIERKPTLRKSRESDTEDVKSVKSLRAKRLSSVDAIADNAEWNYTNELVDHGTSQQQLFSSQTSLNNNNQAYVSQGSLNKHPLASTQHEASVGSIKAPESLYSCSSVHSLSQMDQASRATSSISINSVNEAALPLPPYRPSPDYSLAVRRRMSSHLENAGMPTSSPSSSSLVAQASRNSGVQPPVRQRPHSMIYSQRELQSTNVVSSVINHPPSRHQSTFLSYRRSLQSDGDTCVIDSISPLGDRGTNTISSLLKQDVVKNTAASGDPMLTGSTPVLADPLAHYQINAAHFTKPPAPYASTPDLNYRKTNGFGQVFPLHHQHHQQGDPTPPIVMRRHHHIQPSLLATVNSYTEEDPHYEMEAMSDLVIKNKTPSNDVVFEKAADNQEETTSTPAWERMSSSEDAAQKNVQNYLNSVLKYQSNLQTNNRHSYHSEEDSSVSSVPSAKEVPFAIQNLNNTLKNQIPTAATYSSNGSGGGGTSNIPAPRDDYQLSATTEQDARQQQQISFKDDNLGLGDSPIMKHQHGGGSSTASSSLRTLEKSLSESSISTDKYSTPPPPPLLYTPNNTAAVATADNLSYVDLRSTTTSMEERYDERLAPASSNYNGGRQNTLHRLQEQQHVRLPPHYPPHTDPSQNHQVVLSKGDSDERVFKLEMALQRGLIKEFDEIKRVYGPILGKENGRDRYPNFRPYINSCVRLKPSAKNPQGYINASRLEANVSGKNFRYIACQTPMKTYEEDFWEMIWNENVSIIVLLAHEKEPGNSACARYWGQPNNEPEYSAINCVQYGEYRILTRHVGAEGSTCLTRNLILEKQNEKREVWLFQYMGWPPTGVPQEADDFIAFMDIFQSIRRQPPESIRMKEGDFPIVVQCATGSDRAGVFVLSEILMFALEHSKVSFDQPNALICKTLTQLRMQRMNFVNTFSQYKFVYQSLICFLKKSRLI